MAIVVCLYKNSNMSEITGIILAGGKSSRMGQEKGLLKFKDKFLIEYSIEALKKISDRIIISSNSLNYDFLGYEIVKDEIPNSGPMGGIYSCLKQSKTKNNLVLSCDTPNVSEDLFKYILEKSNGKDIVVPWHGMKFFEPLCGFYNKNTIEVLKKFIDKNNYRIPDVFKEVNFQALLMSEELGFFSKNLFVNINSKKDLEKLL